jgi:hypothetical protein
VGEVNKKVDAVSVEVEQTRPPFPVRVRSRP